MQDNTFRLSVEEDSNKHATMMLSGVPVTMFPAPSLSDLQTIADQLDAVKQKAAPVHSWVNGYMTLARQLVEGTHCVVHSVIDDKLNISVEPVDPDDTSRVENAYQHMCTVVVDLASALMVLRDAYPSKNAIFVDGKLDKHNKAISVAKKLGDDTLTSYDKVSSNSSSNQTAVERERDALAATVLRMEDELKNVRHDFSHEFINKQIISERISQVLDDNKHSSAIARSCCEVTA